jgi:hypothetical protein
MKRIPIRPVIIGTLIGIALYLAPIFILRVGLFILVVGALFRLARRRRIHRFGGYGYSHWNSRQEKPIINLRNRDVEDISID